GGPYRRKEVVFKAIEFDQELNKQINAKNDFLENENPLDDPDAPRFPNPAISTVIVDKIVRDDKDFKIKFDPTHPDANEKGYVMLPNINPVIEMADLIEATRAYQANVSAFQSAKAIATSAIDMMKG
ncbi:flagellar basal body rod protein FlgC, partial [Campylobacter sp.]|uniref:flagellar basal body rod protein FlgC n=1 Tax=Campylobacter sp. TaxID=205 RepID=UPI00259C83A2